jgi:hypothetical protein
MNGIAKNVLYVGIFGLGVLGTSILPGQSADAQVTIGHSTRQRIAFAPNATSAEVQNTNIDSPTRYVLEAKAGQLMDVMVDSANPGVHLTITGANGTFLGSAQDHSGWRGFLPATQDYYINVTKPMGATYHLSVTIPEQIQFARGATSDVLNNSLAPHESRTYLVKASAGQRMSVNVKSASATLTIYGVDGTVLANGNMSGAKAWSGRLPRTEGYIIRVNNHSSSAINYNMAIAIQ